MGRRPRGSGGSGLNGGPFAEASLESGKGGAGGADAGRFAPIVARAWPEQGRERQHQGYDQRQKP